MTYFMLHDMIVARCDKAVIILDMHLKYIVNSCYVRVLISLLARELLECIHRKGDYDLVPIELKLRDVSFVAPLCFRPLWTESSGITLRLRLWNMYPKYQVRRGHAAGRLPIL